MKSMNKKPKLHYSDVTIADLGAVNELYQRHLNGGPQIYDWLREGLSMENYAGVKCMDGEKVVGVFSARPGIDFTCPHPEIEAKILAEYPGKNIYSGETLVVLPEYRGLGIARELALGLRERLIKLRCDIMIAEEWHRRIERDVPASGVLKYLSERTDLLGIYPEFYAGLEELGMTCPQCDGHCQCGALVCAVVLP